MTSDPTSNDRARLLVHAYVDDELDPINAIGVEQQIAADRALAAEAAGVQALRRALRERLPPTEMPAGLEERVRQTVGITGARTASSWRAATWHAPSWRAPTWRAMAASVMLAMIASSAATWLVTRPATDDQLEAVVGGHLRALMAPQPIDVASAEGHVVKPWFNGRIPQAPRVVDLTAAGFPLVGGRVDVVGRAGVPTLVYQIRQHLISLTAIPDAGHASTAPATTAVRGYNVIRWTSEGVSYLAVSDVNAADLGKFVEAFRAPAAAP